MDNPSFGFKIKEARKSAGLSQRELADRIDIDYGYLSKIERGKVPPPSEKIILKIAGILNLDTDELLVLADRPPSDLDPVITEAPYIPAILRRTKGLDSKDWDRIEQLINELQETKQNADDQISTD